MASDLDIEDPEALVAYLRAAGRIDAAERPRMSRLRGGVSNRTVLVERSGGESWVLKQALGKLRVQVDWFCSPERVHREALGLSWLGRLAPAGTIPALVFEDQEHHLLAMRAVPQPHDNWKTALLASGPVVDHVEQFGRLLGTIHQRARECSAEVAPVFSDRSYFEALRLEPYYGYTATRVAAAAAFLREVIEENRSLAITLVHGDYSPKNVLVHEGRLILLDHEVIHFGDPAFDLGFSLTHLLSKAHHLPSRREDFARAAGEYWQAYCAAVGDLCHFDWTDGDGRTVKLEARAVRHTLACLLSRVAGRSPLEYLNEAECRRQEEAVLALISRVPSTIVDLCRRFIDELEN